MFQQKLGLYALTLETSAWAGMAMGVRDDRVLLLYLLAHGGRFDRLWTGDSAGDFDQLRKSSSD